MLTSGELWKTIEICGTCPKNRWRQRKECKNGELQKLIQWNMPYQLSWKKILGPLPSLVWRWLFTMAIVSDPRWRSGISFQTNQRCLTCNYFGLRVLSKVYRHIYIYMSIYTYMSMSIYTYVYTHIHTYIYQKEKCSNVLMVNYCLYILT